MPRTLTVPALTADEVARDRRAARRQAAIDSGNLAAHRMAGRTHRARKGPGSYNRKPKHSNREV